MAAGAAAGSGAAAAAAKAAREQIELKLKWEIVTMFEPIACPSCGRGKLLPLLMTNATNWVCSEPTCTYIIHQHGSDNTKVWKGLAHKPNQQPSDGWLETP
ncbi:MAG: hypothetical protein IT585_05365 [candidate division Zixibacteria bacterium]|nr:hypothetical protein [candidate division Zixibacteria bacterium]